MKISVIQSDITKLSVDAIVNAANSSLLGGGGVDGAIHKAAGKQLLDACRVLNGCKTGEAKYTAGFNLPAKYVIHTVGPIWHGGTQQEPKLLANCYRNSLQIAADLRLNSIAFPAISTGVYRFPIELASSIAIETVLAFAEGSTSLTEIVFCCFSEQDRRIYERLLSRQSHEGIVNISASYE